MAQTNTPTHDGLERNLERLDEPTRRLRRALHADPEVSGEEAGTAHTIQAFMADHGLDPAHTGVGGHGLVYDIVGPDGPAMLDADHEAGAVVFRADMDALPLLEKGNVAHASTVAGRHHACGHDGHMAMLAGALGALGAVERGWQGRLLGVFQPAEETGEGAARLLADAPFNDLPIDRAFALHNIPGEPIGSVLVREGPMASASTGLAMHLEGTASHAAEPHLGQNPIPALAELALVANAGPDLPLKDAGSALITLINLEAGEIAYGTAAGRGTLRLTLRAASDDDLSAIQGYLHDAAATVAKEHGLTLHTERHEPFPATSNAPDAVALVRRASHAASLTVVEPTGPFPWSEDFGHFTQRFGGALVGLGAGNDHPHLHAPIYDFPDDLLPVGMNLWCALATTMHATPTPEPTDDHEAVQGQNTEKRGADQ